jgi:anti-sigma factor RsiW
MIADPCQEYEALILRAVDGAGDAAGRGRLDAHLATCATCREAIDTQRVMRAALVARPAAAASGDFAARTMARIAAGMPRREQWMDVFDFRRWTWRLVPAAAALAVLVLTIGQNTSSSETSPSDGATLAASTDLPVSAALWSSDVSAADLLSLMLEAAADDSLAQSLEGPSQ